MLTLLAGLAWGLPFDDLPSVHQEHARLHLRPATSIQAPEPPLPGDGPDVWVYGYLPYWVDGIDDVPWDKLSHVAIFDVGLESDGSLSSTSRWTSVAADAMSYSDQYGTKIHLTVTCFDDDVMESVLPSASKRAKAIGELADLVDSYGAHGVSVDFEGMSSSLKDDLVDFVAELDAQVDEVTIATPAIDWNGAYDYDALAAHGWLFIMGYGYHWSGGDPGPVAPLYGGDPWSSYSLEWSVDDYLSYDAPADRIILGLPLYGRDWPSTSTAVPGEATADGEAVVMSTAMSQADSYGRLYDSVTETPYAFPDSQSQLWYDDHDSVALRIEWTVDQGLAGTGFWALGYDAWDPDFWQLVEAETNFAGGGDTGPGGSDTGEQGGPSPLLEAEAGLDFTAYVGDIVQLNGSGTGAEELEYLWSQTAGPTAQLSSESSPTPEFTAERGGVYTFELVVRSGSEQSFPDEVDVIVVRTDAGELYQETGGRCSGCAGVQGGAGGLGALLVLLGGVLLRRRR